MSEIISEPQTADRSLQTLPVPSVPMSVRIGTREDIAFMDRLQMMHSKALGFSPRAQMEGFIDGGNVLVAEDAATGEKLGYVASKDRCLKRDELGAVFQLCVAPGRERGFIGANLLREVFERSSYGCRLYCCWCAQDLPANKFWEAMGFVPIAYTAGSAKKSRIHIYWQERIRAGDVTTPYWFPAKTEGGAIREDRIILPIPPGMRWTDELPVLSGVEGPVLVGESSGKITGVQRCKSRPGKKEVVVAPRARKSLQWRLPGAGPTVVQPAPEPVPQAIEKSAKPMPPKVKCDPQLIARARELRDRWMDHVVANGIEPIGRPIADRGKYEVSRVLLMCGSAGSQEANSDSFH